MTSSPSAESMYTIIMSGVNFKLSEASLQSDSPGTNLLAMALLGDFAEAREKTLILERSAVCFALVRDRLNGYTIFPLDPGVCSGLDEARVLRYLKDDAEYYGLERLAEAVRGEIETQASSHNAELRTRSLYASKRLEFEKMKVYMAFHETRFKGHLRNIETVHNHGDDHIRQRFIESYRSCSQGEDPLAEAESDEKEMRVPSSVYSC